MHHVAARYGSWLLVIFCLAVPGCGGDDLPPPQSDDDPVTPQESEDKRGPVPLLLSPIAEELPPELVGLDEPRFGDFDALAERRLIRVLTVFRLGGYFLDGPEERGVTYEAVRAFDEQINKMLGKRHLKVFVVILPVHRDQLIPALLQGYGDIIAANLTITPERQAQVQFSDPLMEDVKELVVTGPAAPTLSGVDDLSGLQLQVRRSSSYWESLELLNERLRSAEKPPVDLVPALENLEDEDLLEMVDAGLLPMVVVDSHKARFWEQIFENIEVREDLALRTGGQIAWAFRKDSPRLEEVVNEFVRTHRQGTLFGNVVLKRYLKETSWVHNAVAGDDLHRFEATIDLFKRYAGEYGFEYLMVAAQGYQESRLDQTQRSRAGAVGVMQLLPSTASDPNVGISNIERLENNIHAGVKYLHFIRSHYFVDAEIAEADKVLFSFAAYNAGPARVRRLREKAEDHVEVVAAKEIGRETVQYVGNICKYYLAYRLLTDKIDEREQSRAEAESLQ
jgi:membrane-bound lytic murein transglycosylase MltF